MSKYSPQSPQSLLSPPLITHNSSLITKKLILKVGARSSPLSLAQTQEVLQELQRFHPDVSFDLILLETVGDKDKITSLRSLDKTDFFTREIDQLQLKGNCRISIHSAKDLPDPLPKGLQLIALTKGVDPSDSLVLDHGKTLQSLTPYSKIATSSMRREEAIRNLRKDLTFVDIRGTIQERLEKLNSKEVSGVVLAEAALIRLQLTHLNRIPIPGTTVPHQGRLAVLARSDDFEMKELFRPLHYKTTLYTGLELPSSSDSIIIHSPLIKICPLTIPKIEMNHFTHFIFTSKNAVQIFFTSFKDNSILKRKFIAVGKGTAKVLQDFGVKNPFVASEETAEGVVELLKGMDTKNSYFFWPHAAKARTVITDYFKSYNIRYEECTLYDTIYLKPETKVDLNLIDEIVFTSSSTVDAFVSHYGQLPKDKILTPIGSITQEHIRMNKIDRIKGQI